MQRRILVSPSAEQRLNCAVGWLSEMPPGELLVVANTRAAADDLLRRAIRSIGGSFAVHRTSLRHLIADLATVPSARAGRTPVGELARTALTARAVHLTDAAAPLGYFAPVATAPGFPRALGRTLSELRRQRVDPAALATSGAPGADLARVLATYQGLLDQRSLSDEARLCADALEVVLGHHHGRIGMPLLLLDLALGSRLEIELLTALIDRSPGVLATYPEGDPRGLERLRRACPGTVETIDEPAAAPTRLGRLRRQLFRADSPAEPATTPAATDTAATPAPANESPKDSSVGYFSAAGEGREAVEISRRILELATTGVPFDDIAVLVRNPNTYQPLLEEAFARARIPAYFGRGSARPDPAGRAFLALLACAHENLSASRFAEYLSLGQAPAADADGAPGEREVPWVEPQDEQLVFKTFELDGVAPEPVVQDPHAPVIAGTLRTPGGWEKLLVESAVVGGHERWQRRLDGKLAEYRRQLDAAAEPDANQREHHERQIARLLNLKRFALPIIQALAALPEAATWGHWLNALRRLATLVLASPDSVLGVLAEMQPMDTVGPVGIAEVQAVLTERLAFLRVEPPRRRFGRVLVAPLAEARARTFPVVFLPGVAEGVFPQKVFEDPLLLDAVRQRLDPDLETRETRSDSERQLLRTAVQCAGRQLILSYPRVDARQGRARVPSFYFLDVLRAADGRLPDLRELEAQAAESSTTRLGWPAPVSPDSAVDDAEYDLAILAPLLAPQAENVRGRGRFLLDANPHLERSLRSRWNRWATAWSGSDGVVDPDPATLEALAAHLPARRSYSATALQSFAGCPYRFLLYAIHRLRPRDEIVQLQQLDPLTRGSMFHEVQAELLRELKAAGRIPLPGQSIETLFDHADRTLAQVARRWRDDIAPAIPRVWDNEIQSLGTDLRGWVRKLALDTKDPFQPAYFELAFGLDDPGRDEHSHADPVTVLDTYQLRGAIDLVEEDPTAGTVRVTDHKTGKAPYSKFILIGGGEILQPVLYALAAEAMLGRKVVAGRLSYCTQRGDYETRDVPWDEHSKAAAQEVLETISDGVQSGFLPAAPKEGACTYCDFKPVCGPFEEIRFQHKNQRDPRLSRLLKLRRRD